MFRGFVHLIFPGGRTLREGEQSKRAKLEHSLDLEEEQEGAAE